MSFFDEVDEPRAEPPTRTQRRRPPPGRGRRPPGGGRTRGPSGPQQAIRTRRAIALTALVIVVILIVIGVHSCQVSQDNNALRNYATTVASLMQSSDRTSAAFFTLLSGGHGPAGAGNLTSQIDENRIDATRELNTARGLSPPGQLSLAHQELILTLRMRANAITAIGQELPSALQAQTSSTAVTSIAANNAQFYSSDVLYKDYVLPQIVGALHAAGIPAGGANGEPISQGQSLPGIDWLNPRFVAAELSAPTSSAHGGKLKPGTHGHALNSVSVGGKTLQTGVTNTVPAHPAPTFTLNFTNSGQNTETGVICKVTVGGSSISGQATVASTSAGQSYSCHVTLNGSPAAGNYTVKATIEPVPGEKNVSNNTQTYSVSFQ